MDAADYRQRSREHWDSAAAGWARREGWIQATSAPVSKWLIEAAGVAPGQRVLELAAGTGDVSILAAERLAPTGTLICSDRSGPMLTRARRRAAERGLGNIEFKLFDAESIDLPLASVDAALCRWGYMLMADPAAALRETRRVLRPGGRLALAVWDRIERNPWSAIPWAAVLAHDLREPPDPLEPGPFALGDASRLEELLAGAGFTEIVVDAVELIRPDPDFATWWDGHLALSTVTRQAVSQADARTLASVEAQMREALRPYTAPDASLAVPARTLVAAATS